MSYDDDGYSTGYVVGSLPKDFGYGPEENDADPQESLSDQKPRILLMGLRRSGKSSIQKVVFHKMSPNETLFLESTNKIIKDDISNSSFVRFQIWDFPGQIDFFDPTFDSDMIFGGCGALVFVIDAQDDYMDALNKLHMTVTRAYKVNPNIKFEVFVHKVDGLSDDHKIETQRDIHQRANDDLADAGLENVHLSFYLTSIYDHSIFEAFSKVVQKLIPQLPTLENLLNIFISNSGIEKAFLFDVVSKIYIATDSSPVDMQSYELCCDMIDVVIDISCIYGLKDDGESNAFDNQSSSIIKLNNATILYLREVNKFLALVCILREDNFDRQGLIDYNFHCFRQAIQEVFEVKIETLDNSSLSSQAVSPEEMNHSRSMKGDQIPCSVSILKRLTMASRPLISDYYDKNHLDRLYSQLQVGDRLEYKRDLGYSHWALYSGSFVFPNGRIEHRIIHRSVPPGLDLGTLSNQNSLLELICSKAVGTILESPLESAIAGTDTVRINNSLDELCTPLSGEEAVKRAILKMAESPQKSYNLFSNNCEHFVNECRYSKSFSQQVVDGSIAAFMKLYESSGPDEGNASIMRAASEFAKSFIPAMYMREPPD